MKKIFLILMTILSINSFSCEDHKIHYGVREIVEQNIPEILKIENAEMTFDKTKSKEFYIKDANFWEKAKVEKEAEEKIRILIEGFKIYCDFHGIDLIIVGDD